MLTTVIKKNITTINTNFLTLRIKDIYLYNVFSSCNFNKLFDLKFFKPNFYYYYYYYSPHRY